MRPSFTQKYFITNLRPRDLMGDRSGALHHFISFFLGEQPSADEHPASPSNSVLRP